MSVRTDESSLETSEEESGPQLRGAASRGRGGSIGPLRCSAKLRAHCAYMMHIRGKSELYGCKFLFSNAMNKVINL